MKEISIENIETALWFANSKSIHRLMQKYSIEKYEGRGVTFHILAECIYVNIPTNNTDYCEQFEWLRKEING